MEHRDRGIVRREVFAGVFKKGQRVQVNHEENEAHGLWGTVFYKRDKDHNANIVAIEGDEGVARVYLDDQLEEPRGVCRRG